MNERIRELAREAGFYANPDVEKFEKFAQLIVRECVAICQDIDGVSVGLDCAVEIKQHFGVAE